MSETTQYSNRFQSRADVASYESLEYGVSSYSSQVWQWQRPVLEQIIREFQQGRKTPVRLLDFACGTGRVLSQIESLVASAEGVDISENMVSLARAKCRQARLKVGDILTQTDLLQDKYDLITTFRFLLNVEPEMRRRVLCKLRTVVREPDGLLVLNVHGNSRSLRHPAILWRRWREQARPTGAMLNEMSPAESRSLLRECGFAVVRQIGFGILPPTLYRTPVRGAVEMVDKFFAGKNVVRNCSIDLMFVCRPC